MNYLLFNVEGKEVVFETARDSADVSSYLNYAVDGNYDFVGALDRVPVGAVEDDTLAPAIIGKTHLVPKVVTLSQDTEPVKEDAMVDTAIKPKRGRGKV